MHNDTVLKSGLAGYIYRWLCNGGVVALTVGIGWIAFSAYHAITDGRAVATVTGLEVVCVLEGQSLLTRAIAREVECGEAEALKAANASLNLEVRDVAYARFRFQSEIGAGYDGRLSLSALQRPDLQRGDTISVLYDRSNPSAVRAIADAASYFHSALLALGGLFMLALAFFARRAVSYNTGVDREIAALERAYAARNPAARRR
jgi:hypothetical protein